MEAPPSPLSSRADGVPGSFAAGVGEPRDLRLRLISNGAQGLQNEFSSRPERSYRATLPTATNLNAQNEVSSRPERSAVEGPAVPLTPPPNPELVTKIVEILNHGNPESQAVVLPMLAALPSDSPWATNPEDLSALRTLLTQQPRP